MSASSPLASESTWHTKRTSPHLWPGAGAMAMLVAAATVLIRQWTAVTPADAPLCPSLLRRALALVLGAAPHLPAASFVHIVDTALLCAAAVACFDAVRRAGVPTPIATMTGGLVALVPATAPRWGDISSAETLAASLAMHAALHRGSRIAVGAAAAGVAVLAWFPCTILDQSLAARLQSIAASITFNGPFLPALAVLGALSARGMVSMSAWGVLVAFAIALGGAELTGRGNQVVFVSMLTAAALGLTAIWRGVGGALRSTRLSSSGVVALLPLVLLLGWTTRRGDPMTLQGTELSTADLRDRINRLPANAAIVPDDGLTELQVRAAGLGANRLRGLPHADDRGDLETVAPLFVMPGGAAALLPRAAILEPVVDVPGFARVVGFGACYAVADRWRQVSPWPAAAISVGSLDPASAGPVVVYATFTEAPRVGPRAWPVASRRGYYADVFELVDADARSAFERQRADDGVPEAMFADMTHVARLEIARPLPSSAPIVDFGVTPRAVSVKLLRDPDQQGLRVCPVASDPKISW